MLRPFSYKFSFLLFLLKSNGRRELFHLCSFDDSGNEFNLSRVFGFPSGSSFFELHSEFLCPIFPIRRHRGSTDLFQFLFPRYMWRAPASRIPFETHVPPYGLPLPFLYRTHASLVRQAIRRVPSSQRFHYISFLFRRWRHPGFPRPGHILGSPPGPTSILFPQYTMKHPLKR